MKLKKNKEIKKKITICQFIKQHPDNKRLHNIWSGMKARCCYPTDKDYRYYGALGVYIDPIWKKDFFIFHTWALSHGYDRTLTLMRINRKGPYEANNCKWVTIQEQQETRTNTVLLEVDGVKKSIYAWSKEKDISYTLIRKRIKNGIKGKALFAPSHPTIAYHGKEKTLAEWAVFLGIPYGTLYGRYYRDGKRGTDLFKPTLHRMKKNEPITIDGETHTLKEWSVITRLNYPTIQSRYKSGKRGLELIKPAQSKK